MSNHIPKDQNSYPPADVPSNMAAATGYTPASSAYAGSSAPAYAGAPSGTGYAQAPGPGPYATSAPGYQAPNYTPTSGSAYQGANYPPSSGPPYSNTYPPSSGPGYAYQQPGQAYAQPQHSYAPYGGYSQSGPSSLGIQPLPLPVMTPAAPAATSQAFNQQHQPDNTGQIAPPGMKPRVTATLWEDEGSLCFQVEAKGVCVARREDNHYINGTKLLNVAGMTRGRRDGILKSEKQRHVVKIGPMHLKGVWIPFDRALEFANKEKITEDLYPLFVHDISALLYPTQTRQPQPTRFSGLPGPPTGQAPGAPYHSHSLSNPIASTMSQPPQSIQPHPTSGRPELGRAHTFPTPPTSASSLIGMSNQSSSHDWNGMGYQNSQGGQPLNIDTGLSNTRSVPATPATTPPGPMQPGMGYSTSQGYDNSRVGLYSGAPPQTAQYPTSQSQPLMPYRQPEGAYVKAEMAPPGQARDHGDVKPSDGMLSQNSQQVNHAADDGEGDHEHDNEYTHTNASYNASRNAYAYAGAPSGTVHNDHPHLSPEAMTNSPHQNGSGRQTPRTTNAGQSQWNAGGYPGMAQRQSAPSSNVYNVMGNNTDNGTNGNATNSYAPTDATAQYQTNGKRSRDDDDHNAYSRPDSAQGEDVDGMKRRKTLEGGAVNPTGYRPPSANLQRARPVVAPRPNRQ